jgi:Tol biopolymer transport system component
VDERPAGRLWRIDVNTATPGRGSPIADIPAGAVNPSMSRATGESARLAFQTTVRDIDLQLMDLEAHRETDIIDSKPFSNSTRIEGSSRFSPDASSIAFVSLRSGGPEVWIARRDGSDLRQITSLGGVGVMVGDWSPDGRTIAFEAAVDGNTDVYLVGADGGHLRRLTSEPSIDGVPAWSGDGRWIYFASTRAGAVPDIWRVSPNGGDPTRVTRDGGFEPRESIDGQSLYYLDRHPGGRMAAVIGRVMRVPLAGGEDEPMVDRARPFLWGLTSRGIVFVTREQDFDAIDMYSHTDRRISRVGRLGFRIPSRYVHMSVSRDGRWVLATKMIRFDSDLMRLDNFR